MGMFNSIIANLSCSTYCARASREIQIKWQIPAVRSGKVYYLGGAIEDILPEYNNTWVRTDFVCESCSPRTEGRVGQSFIKVMDQQRHVVFVRVDDSQIIEIISEKDFERRNVTEFATDIL